MHYQLRTEGGSPGRNAAAVSLGVFLGCLPVYGIHIVLCAALARLLRLSRVRAYLATHVNNPLTVGPLTLLEFGIGRWLIRGTWPRLDLAEIASTGWWRVAADLAVGAAVLGVGAGAVAGLAAWVVASRWSAPSPEDTFREAVSRRFTRTGIVDWEFARAKLRHDPVHLRLLRAGAIPSGGRLLDLGCGRGILGAAIAVAREMAADGRWPETWPAPPRPDGIVGVDSHRRHVRAARKALADRGAARVVDLRSWAPPPFRTAVLVDVLHDLDDAGQRDLLRRLVARMDPGGRLVVREIDPSAGWRRRVAAWGERLAASLRPRGRRGLNFRDPRGWADVLGSVGLETHRLSDERPGEFLATAVRAADASDRATLTPSGAAAARSDAGISD